MGYFYTMMAREATRNVYLWDKKISFIVPRDIDIVKSYNTSVNRATYIEIPRIVL